jgi:hypothetical protein
VWQTRGENAGVDIHTAASWLRAESQIWESVHEIADTERKYRWQDRVNLIHRIRTNCHTASTCTPGFPPEMGLDDDAAADGHDLSCQRIEERLNDLRRSMEPAITRENLVRDTPFCNDTPYSNSEEGQKVLRDAVADSLTWLSAKTVRKLSVRYAATWQRLGDWLELRGAQKSFRQAVGSVPQLARRPVPKTDNRKLPI